MSRGYCQIKYSLKSSPEDKGAVPMDGRRQFPDADGQFENAPYFNFNDGKVKFDTNWFDNANDNYGSASGFLPKSL